MEAWAGLIGVLAGAAIAIAGQLLTQRTESRERVGLLVLEQCSHLIGLSEDYRNRFWEERHGLSTDAVGGWDLGAYRVAQARLRVLCRDSEFLDALTDLQETGIDIGRGWRLSQHDTPEIEAAWQAHRVALDHFIDVSAPVVRRWLRTT